MNFLSNTILNGNKRSILFTVVVVIRKSNETEGTELETADLMYRRHNEHIFPDSYLVGNSLKRGFIVQLY